MCSNGLSTEWEDNLSSYKFITSLSCKELQFLILFSCVYLSPIMDLLNTCFQCSLC